MEANNQRAIKSLIGLSVGDGFGECFFSLPQDAIDQQVLPDSPWRWTDDTHMALSIVEVLHNFGRITQDELARSFAKRFLQEPWRGYAGGAQRLLSLYAQGADWREEAPKLFNGGSYGNGGAMRAAPIGAFFAGDPVRAAIEAKLSAEVTHAHLEGQVGAMAVAIASAIVCGSIEITGRPFLDAVADHIPASRTRDGIVRAAGIEAAEVERARSVLGTGIQVAAFDTVPYCLWVVAYHATDFVTALWTTVAGLGDRDTTCAIVGGIIAPGVGVPQDWRHRRESLPEGFET
jgi:ADP-ribosylglycohydrolase